MNLPKFKNQKLFEQAFTHRSYLNETKESIDSNERLEFLGDSIISFLVSKHLYQLYPQHNEGTLTNLRSLLVNTKSLGNIANELGFGEMLKLSKGEHEAKGRENMSILADCFEAYVGGLFLDQGIDEVEKFVNGVLLKDLEQIASKKSLKDPKSLLQEYAQSRKRGSPAYKVTSEEGPAHARRFTVAVYIAERLLGQGQGKSKQEAEEHAANQALENIKVI